MAVEPGLAVAIVVPAVMALVWLLRLESRIASHEQVCAVRQKSLDERHEEIRDSLQRLDAKLDRLMGGAS